MDIAEQNFSQLNPTFTGITQLTNINYLGGYCRLITETPDKSYTKGYPIVQPDEETSMLHAILPHLKLEAANPDIEVTSY